MESTRGKIKKHNEDKYNIITTPLAQRQKERDVAATVGAHWLIISALMNAE